MGTLNNERLSLKDLPLSNDWLFGKTMSDPELCRVFLELVLHLKIREVKLVSSQQTIDNRLDAKGIRLDIFAADDDNTIYNVEIQMRNENIPKRSRYYQSSLDMALLKKGESYKNLNTSYIIFICTFDLFGQDRHLYSFQNRCDQDHGLLLEDGAYRLFLNTKGKLDDVDQEIREFLTYLEQSTEMTVKSSKGELVKKVHKKVEFIRNSKESEVEFMTFMEKLREEREAGLEEGIEKNRLHTAEKMLRAGIPIETITEITEFTKEELNDIQQKMEP